MISQKYKDMLGQKSVIREMSAAGHKMGEEIGFDNVFDYSLGIRAYLHRKRWRM